MKLPPWILQFAPGCHHDQLSRVFTIKKRTYRVCLECGREFEYSWTLMRAESPAVGGCVYAPSNNTVRAEVVAIWSGQNARPQS